MKPVVVQVIPSLLRYYPENQICNRIPLQVSLHPHSTILRFVTLRQHVSTFCHLLLVGDGIWKSGVLVH
jgi:hypothetical protein